MSESAFVLLVDIEEASELSFLVKYGVENIEEASELSFLVKYGVETFVADKQMLPRSSLLFSSTRFRARSKGMHPHGIVAVRLG
jgi:hypothetical protein